MAKSKQNGGAGKSLVSMNDLKDLYAAEAKAAAQAAPTAEGPPRISAKDQVFWVGEQVLPDPLEVIVVAEALLNVWYETDYDPENPAPPSCFALGYPSPGDADGSKSMQAHATSPNMQGGPAKDALEHPCATCEMNQWGSAKIGRGKACANNRKLAVVMANDPALTGSGDLRFAELTLSPTALGPWGKFVNSLAKIEGRPPHGTVVQFSFNKTDKDERRRKAVVPIGYRLIDSPAVAQRVIELRKEVLESGVLVRPLPVEVRAAAPKKPAAKASAPKKKAAAQRARF